MAHNGDINIFGEYEIGDSDNPTYYTESSPYRSSPPNRISRTISGQLNGLTPVEESPIPSGLATPTPSRYPLHHQEIPDLFNLEYKLRAEWANNQRHTRAKQILDEQRSVLEKTKRVLDYLRTLDLDIGLFIATCSGLPHHQFLDDIMLEKEYDVLVLNSSALLGLDDPEIEDAYMKLRSSEHLRPTLLQWHQPPKTRKRQFGVRYMSENKAVEAASLICIQRVLGREATTLAEVLKGLDAQEEGPNEMYELWKRPIEDLRRLRVDTIAAQIRHAGPTTWSLISTVVNPDSVEHRQKNFTILYVVATMMYRRNRKCNQLTKLLTIYLKSNGLAVRALDALHYLGILMSNSWVAQAFGKLADDEIKEMKLAIQKKPFIISHDNLQVPIRVFSHRKDHQDHFANLTAANVYILPKEAVLSSDQVIALRNKVREGSAECFNYELLAEGSVEQDNRLRAQYTYQVLRFLIESPGFRGYKYKDSQVLQEPPPVELIEVNEPAQVFMLQTIDTEESSYEGNIRAVTEVLSQVDLTSEVSRKCLGLHAFLVWVGDQLTSERLRGIKRFRQDDVNSFERWDWLGNAFGWFHLEMAFANSLYDQYGGSNTGILLRKAWTTLNRKGLSSKLTKGPFWNNLDSMLRHMAEAHFRLIWLLESGIVTYAQIYNWSADPQVNLRERLAEMLIELTNYEPERLANLAERIVNKYASTEEVQRLRNATPAERQDEHQIVTTMFLRDVLPYLELRNCIKRGDVGRLDDLIPTILWRFAGGSNPKYTIELLELLQSYHREWTPEIKHYVRHHCFLINTTGFKDGFKAIDQHQEHCIKGIKVTWRSIGPGAQVLYIQKISPAIPRLRGIQKYVDRELNAYKRGQKHTSPSKEGDLQHLMEMYAIGKVHTPIAGRKLHMPGDFCGDIVSNGVLALHEKAENWFTNRSFKRSTEEDYSF